MIYQKKLYDICNCFTESASKFRTEFLLVCYAGCCYAIVTAIPCHFDHVVLHYNLAFLVLVGSH
ncbi:hypothetical protein SLEP1_g27874 [Rubroshorea leprosula]|uniref:Uncharacterized protein n=1 Tax=Rubroshorea leprosula TaxID=152421 RepID=A0AAV5JYW9_9ROSI|nr:hypothetical protein SLEP1_g27874 [Rubroshorea leprosula]